MNDYKEFEVSPDVRHNRLRFAALWNKDIKALQKMLKGLGVAYPLRHKSQSKEDYRLSLIDLVIKNEQRIA
jgi:hypothetical protein